MFRAWNTVSMSLRGQTTHTRSAKYRNYHGIREADSARASPWLRIEHAADMVSHLAGPGCLIESKYKTIALDTSLGGQTRGLVGVVLDFRAFFFFVMLEIQIELLSSESDSHKETDISSIICS